MTMRKFFWKRFKHFFLVMLIPLLVLTAVSMGFQYKSSMNVLTAESANALTRMDENLNGAISTSAYQYELMTYNPRLVLSLKKFFQHETFSYSDVVLLNSIRTMMGSVAQSHDFIASIYLYLDGYVIIFPPRTDFSASKTAPTLTGIPCISPWTKKAVSGSPNGNFRSIPTPLPPATLRFTSAWEIFPVSPWSIFVCPIFRKPLTPIPL